MGWTEFRAPPRQVLPCAPGREQMAWPLVRMSAHTVFVLTSFPSSRHFKLSLSRTELSNPHLPHLLNVTLLTSSHFSERSQHPLITQIGSLADSSFSLMPTIHESLSPTPCHLPHQPLVLLPMATAPIHHHLALDKAFSLVSCLGLPWWLRW